MIGTQWAARRGLRAKQQHVFIARYDILYDEVSVFLVTGNYPAQRQTRSAPLLISGVPILSTGNALIGQVSPSLEELEETIGEDELRRLAEDRTLDSSLATLGVSQTLTNNLQVAGDVSWSKIDSAPASGGVEAMESTGDEFYYSLQLIGSGLVKQGDISSVGARYGDSKYRDTYSLTLNIPATRSMTIFCSTPGCGSTIVKIRSRPVISGGFFPVCASNTGWPDPGGLRLMASTAMRMKSCQG